MSYPRKTTKAKRTQKNGTQASTMNSSLLHKQNILPLTMTTQLSYVDGSQVRNNPGNNYLVWGLRLNDMYDPDPAILSGSISGYQELMKFYGRYRTISNHIECTIANNEDFPINWGIVVTDVNVLGSISNAQAALNLLENGYSTGARCISSKYGFDRDRQVLNINLYELVGNKTVYEGDLDYTGAVATSPLISLWVFFVITSGTGATLSNGVVTNIKLTYRSKFFDRNILLA